MRRTSSSGARRRHAIVLCALGLAAGCPSAAFAHASVVRIDPPAQTVVAKEPAAIVLHFDEGVVAVRGGVDVTGPNGGSALAADAHLARGDNQALVVPLVPGLGRGDYTVRWRVVTADDGHFVDGAFAIGVGAGLAPPQLPTTEGSAVDSGYLVARFLYFIGLLVLVGAAITRLAVFAPALRSVTSGPEARAEVERIERTSFGVLAFASVALVIVGGWAAVVRQSTELAGVSFWAPLTSHAPLLEPIGRTRFGREFGHGLNAATVFFLLVLLLFALRNRRTALYVLGLAAAVAGGWALVGPGLGGHAGDAGRGWLAVAVDAAHLAGVAVWFGGLAHLFLVTGSATASLEPVERRRVRLDAAQRFSRIALASVILIAATGAGRALWELGAVSQIWSTAYGRTLLIKTALFGGLIVLGYKNRKTLANFTALRRRAGLELALLVALTAAVSLLTDLAPGKNTGAPRGGAIARTTKAGASAEARSQPSARTTSTRR